MCGRFTLRTSASEIAQQFGVLEVAPFAARFNIAPTQAVAVVRTILVGTPQDLSPKTQDLSPFFSPRELVWLRWGLVPSWARDAAIGSRLINARAETAASKPAFRAALRRRRCLVVADGFYEWQRAGRSKQPYYIRLHGHRPFGFAGLWEAWEGPMVGQVGNLPDTTSRQVGNLPHVLETCTVLTTAANDLVRPLHDRMPVILEPAAYASWLDPEVEDPRQLMPLLAPYPSGEMEAYRVSPLVNQAKHESLRCIEPAAGALF